MPILTTPGITFSNGITMAGEPAMSESGLIAQFDASNPASYSGTGSTWYDLSGNGNDFTLIGDTPYTADGQKSYFTFSSGIAQSATAILPTQAYTKIGVFRVAGAFGNLISGGVTDYDHAFWGASTEYLQAGHNGNWNQISSDQPVSPDQWVFGAVTFSTETGWVLYLNGTPNWNYDVAPFSAPSVVQIGGFQGNDNNLGGDVAMVKLYDRALSESEIADQHAQFQNRFLTNSSYTINASDFSSGTGYGFYGITQTDNNGYTADTNAGLYSAMLFYNPTGDIMNTITDAWNAAGLAPNKAYVWNATWASYTPPGGPPVSNYSCLVRAAYGNTSTPGAPNGTLLITIDQSDTRWQSGNLSSQALAGEFTLPVTLTAYTPIKRLNNANSWC